MTETMIKKFQRHYRNSCIRLNMNFIRIGRNFLLLFTFWVLVLLCAATLWWKDKVYLPLSHSKVLGIHKPKLLIWWTTMPANYTSTRYCGIHMCTFVNDRTEQAEAAAILFYASDLRVHDFPLPRTSHKVWGLLHEESPRNVPYIPHTAVLQHFNYTSTFSRFSDFPLTTHYLLDLHDLTSPAYFVPVGEKTRLREKELLAPIAFMQSDCDTMSGRDDYVRELSQYIAIDSYGACLKNRDLPKNLTEDFLNNLYSPELLKFLGRYKFILSYENGICNDYITEKFWRPLMIGVIPIYFGSPTIRDWEPNNKSVIHIMDFESPKALAEFVLALDKNDTEYNTYLDHKYEQLEPITNKRLLKDLKEREYTPANDNFFNAFECFMCRQLYEKSHEQTKMATASHYDCPYPLKYPSMSSAVGNKDEWTSVMAVGRCQADIINNLLQRNKVYTSEEYDRLLNRKMHLNQCN